MRNKILIKLFDAGQLGSEAPKEKIKQINNIIITGKLKKKRNKQIKTVHDI